MPRQKGQQGLIQFTKQGISGLQVIQLYPMLASEGQHVRRHRFSSGAKALVLKAPCPEHIP